MTWVQLADQIRAMSHEEKLLPVRFFEDTVDGSPGLTLSEVNFDRADFDKEYSVNGGSFIIRKGEPYLW